MESILFPFLSCNICIIELNKRPTPAEKWIKSTGNHHTPGKLFSQQQFDSQLEKRVDDESLSLSSLKLLFVYVFYPLIITASTTLLVFDFGQYLIVYLVLILLVMLMMAWHKGVNRLSYLRQLSIAWTMGAVAISSSHRWVQATVIALLCILYLFNGEEIGKLLGKLNGVLKYTGALVILLPMLVDLPWKTNTMMFAALIVAGLILCLNVIIAIIVMWIRRRKTSKIDNI